MSKRGQPLGWTDLSPEVKAAFIEMEETVHLVPHATFKKVRGGRKVVGLCGTAARRIAYEAEYITCSNCRVAGDWVAANGKAT